MNLGLDPVASEDHGARKQMSVVSKNPIAGRGSSLGGTGGSSVSSLLQSAHSVNPGLDSVLHLGHQGIAQHSKPKSGSLRLRLAREEPSDSRTNTTGDPTIVPNATMAGHKTGIEAIVEESPILGPDTGNTDNIESNKQRSIMHTKA